MKKNDVGRKEISGGKPAELSGWGNLLPFLIEVFIEAGWLSEERGTGIHRTGGR